MSESAIAEERSSKIPHRAAYDRQRRGHRDRHRQCLQLGSAVPPPAAASNFVQYSPPLYGVN